MLIESIKIDELHEDPANARRHDDKNLKAIKGSLKKFGQQKPIVVDKNNIVVAGNGTLAAAKAIGWDSIDIVRTKLEGTQATAFALADNRSSELAAWDDEVLNKTLKALTDEMFDITEIGFDLIPEAEIVPEGLTDPDSIPEDVETRCKLGDLWLLGNHRLLCGDSTDVLQVERLMGGEKADMVFTDPPYGMNLDTDYSSMTHKDGRSGNKFRPVIGDNQDFDPGILFGYFDYVKEIFLWGADYYCQHLPKNGSWIVWDKRESERVGTQMSEKMFGSMFELCWSKEKHKRYIARIMWAGGTGQGESEERKGRNNCIVRFHPTQKPIELCEYFFEKWGKDKDKIVDLFLGSGSTLIACEKTKRECYGMEIDPKYCDVILERWEKFTGKTATLIES